MFERKVILGHKDTVMMPTHINPLTQPPNLSCISFFFLYSPSSLVLWTSRSTDVWHLFCCFPSSPSCRPDSLFHPLPALHHYWPNSQFPARPQGSFPVCHGAGGNLSRETNCLVAASCEHLAQLGMLSWVTPPETECRHLHTQTRARAQAHTTCSLAPVLPSALYNYGPQGNVM